MYPNYYPFYSYSRPNYYPTSNVNTTINTTNNSSIKEETIDNKKDEKKDIVQDTIPFENYYNANKSAEVKTEKSKTRFFNFNKQEISIGNITLQTDDLIIIGIIILLFIESEDNMLLIVVLGLLLLNINLGDILSLF